MSAPLIGLVVGAVAWMLFGHGSSEAARLDDLADRTNALAAPPELAVEASGRAGAMAAGSPIFALTTGPGAVVDVALGLSGLSVTHSRSAALLSIGGKPAEWLAKGETRDGVTVDEVQDDKVVVDTPTGSKEMVLGAKAQAASSPGGGPGPSEGPPLGFRSPPAPASAPP
jgi:hypothetical protein